MNKSIRVWYKNTIGYFIPEYAFFSLISCFLVNSFIYWGSQLLMKDKYHYDFTTWLDNQIPFMKEWVIIYLICYIFWMANYILVTHEGREKWFQFAFADMLSRLICGVFFVLIPTTNIRPLISGNDVCSRLMRLVYQMDQPSNLFPSIHCLVSWFCFIGIRNSKKIPFWYKIFSCIFAILVFLSTQFTKQHYLIDIAGGVLIAELSYFIACRTRIYLKLEKIFLWVNVRIFGESNHDE